MSSPSQPHDSGASRAAFSEFLSDCHIDVLTYAFSLVHNMADAEDICQRVAIILWDKFDEFEPGTDFKRWALRTTKLVSLNTIRRRQRDRLVFSDEVVQLVADTAYEEALSQTDTQARWENLRQCVEKLPLRQRDLLRTYYGERLSIPQLAEKVGRTERAVSSSLSRSRISVRGCIKRLLQQETAR